MQSIVLRHCPADEIAPPYLIDTHGKFTNLRLSTNAKMESQQTSRQQMTHLLDSRPTRKELLVHVPLGPQWYTVGICLDLDTNELNTIKSDNDDFNKVARMYNLWLGRSKSNATRRQLIEVLKDLGINDTAVNYMNYIGKNCKICYFLNEPYFTVHTKQKPADLMRPQNQHIYMPAKISIEILKPFVLTR